MNRCLNLNKRRIIMATKRQLKAIDNLVGNGGNVTKAMRDAGYSENTINTPAKLTESKAFNELMSEAITDAKLIKVRDDGLTASRTIVVDESAVDVPDHATRHKFLETALKVKGAFKNDPAGEGNTFNFINNANFKSKDYLK